MRATSTNGNAEWTRATLGQLSGERGKSIEPAKTPENQFELYSVPSFPDKKPEVVSGKEVGSNKQLVEPRSVLLCKINPRINRVWVVGDFTPHTKIASTEWIIFPATEAVVPDFLCYFLQKNAVRDFLAHNASGVGGSLMRVKPSTIRDFPFEYPKPKEQRRIVAEIEKQFTRLEAGVAALRRVQANLKRYRAAVLKAACEGKLVPTEHELSKAKGRKKDETTSSFLTPPSSFESGEALLQRILAERRQNWQGRGKYKEPAAPDATKLGSLPEGWTWASADQISSQITDGEHIQPKYTDVGYPMLSAKHVRNGFVIYTDVPFISETDFKACLKRCAPTRDDILIVCVGATTGRAAIVGDAKPFAVVRSVLLFRTMIHPRFMLAWVQSPWCQTWIQSASGSSAQAHFYINNAKQMCVPLPPLAEQTRIVAEVERRLSVVEELESVVTANLQRASRLRQSILQKAFTGQL